MTEAIPIRRERPDHSAMRRCERRGDTRRGVFAGCPDNGLSAFYGKRLV